MIKKPKVLLFGIGNSGRADDGLGWLFIDRIAKELPKNYDCEYRYQLQIEDAELASHYDIIYFIDAHQKKNLKGFSFKPCFAKNSDSYTSHELLPSTILFLIKSIYNKNPEAYILGVSGEDFSLKIGLSKEAKNNLSKSLTFFKHKIISNPTKYVT